MKTYKAYTITQAEVKKLLADYVNEKVEDCVDIEIDMSTVSGPDFKADSNQPGIEAPPAIRLMFENNDKEEEKE